MRGGRRLNWPLADQKIMDAYWIKRQQAQEGSVKEMGRVLPILFNTDMVRAVLDGRKTVTRRAVRYKYNNTEMKMRTDKYGTRLIEIQKAIEGETHGKNPDGSTWHKLLPYIEKNPPYRKGDIIYVRETFRPLSDHPAAGIEYAADWSSKYFENSKEPDCCNRGKWIPSIHMPKQAARIWLKVTDVRAERLQDIDTLGCQREGIDITRNGVIKRFSTLWDSTLKKKDLALYGWEVNPWVWVIGFERCEKPEEG